MKIRLPWTAMIALSLLLVPLSLAAQDFTITRYTIGSATGTSTSEATSVTGTIGQAEVGDTSTGDGFSVTGGFWTIPHTTDEDVSTSVWMLY